MLYTNSLVKKSLCSIDMQLKMSAARALMGINGPDEPHM